MTEVDAIPGAARCGPLTTAHRYPKARDEVMAGNGRVNHLVSELLSAAHEIARRYGPTYTECDALKSWLTQAGADGKLPLLLDALTERIIEDNANKTARVGISAKGHGNRPERILATVLFTDIVDSTRHAADLGDRTWLELLGCHDEIARAEIARFHGRVVRHTGDGVLAIFDGPSRAVQSATILSESIAGLGIGIRCGLHTGECELRGDDIGGIAVHTGARIAALARAGEVLVSKMVKDLVNGSGIAFQDRGTHFLKGIPGEWPLFACA
ncbi:dioxygenase [Mycobacterium colombiense]|uniref:dioxygenase n=1 Tax=Mycobacterium colombiense TaxID=339268 RepID=UPI00080079BF|nr:hypothetical protein A9W93_12430 [Mycobacterium colombiense]